MTRLTAAALALACALSTQLAAQSKPLITPKDYGKWELLGASRLSPRGDWVAVPIARVSEENELRIRGGPRDTTIVVAYGSGRGLLRRRQMGRLRHHRLAQGARAADEGEEAHPQRLRGEEPCDGRDRRRQRHQHILIQPRRTLHRHDAVRRRRKEDERGAACRISRPTRGSRSRTLASRRGPTRDRSWR